MRASLGWKILVPVCLVLLPTAPAVAGNQPEKAQRRVEEDVLPKIVLACGVSLSVKYDGDSLRKHNKDIGYDQTDGDSECNEPLRYLWYACQTDAGKAAVKAARISKVACTGVPGATGSLTLSAGTITVGRAFEEKQPYVRSRKQFEALLKMSLKLGSDDPYPDEAWHKLAQAPNPVTSTKTYCLANGEKVAYGENVHDPFCRRKQDATVKCWKDGEIVVDLDIRQGRKTGFLTWSQDRGSHRAGYRDDKQHGEQKTIRDGKVKTLALHDNGERLWAKEFHPDGKLASYSRKFAGGSAELTIGTDGNVHRLACLPAAKDDKDLRKWCGFDGAQTTPIYDGTGKVARVATWKDGVILKEGPGTSDYATRSEVSFKDGKKHGEERVFGKDGKLASVTTWDDGTRDGREVFHAEDGKKVVKEIIWKAGQTTQLTEFYLNGNPKLKETYEHPKKKHVKAFWDTGKASREGDFLSCAGQGYRYRTPNWCEDGVHKSYFESGTPDTEEAFVLGKRHGPSRSWWPSGRPSSVEEYADDKLTKAKRWDKNGKLIADDEFEADGSRKIKR